MPDTQPAHAPSPLERIVLLADRLTTLFVTLLLAAMVALLVITTIH